MLKALCETTNTIPSSEGEKLHREEGSAWKKKGGGGVKNGNPKTGHSPPDLTTLVDHDLVRRAWKGESAFS